MSIYNQFATDKEKETEGVVVPYSANEDGSVPSFKIARMGKSNKKYTKAMERATRPYRRQVELGALSEEVSEKILLGVFVDTILLGWENVLDRDGNKIPYNRDNAMKVMTDLPDLYADLQAQASSAAQFREEQREAEAKN